MRYWDVSALVPLIVSEPGSRLARTWLLEDDHIVTWAWTRTEITSAIERRTREGALTRRQRRTVLGRLRGFAAGWDEVIDVLSVRARANAVLARHPLRAADAGQLGAALLVSEQLSDPLVFLCLDQRLSDAAEREGLGVADTGD
ncbi:type II toxin-antitoxin system VapC family toxin [Candidatus Palauibacter sp.]|uniref:type II toxin-antitoxin system VapC family toxin n=1 Tax=Candidatus Palauibacter sp. TaxID=3101350 RepID=UPI003AF2C881